MSDEKKQERTNPGLNEDEIAVIRAEERERCAKVLEAEGRRVLDEYGGMIGEIAMYDLCALIVRQIDTGMGQN